MALDPRVGRGLGDREAITFRAQRLSTYRALNKLRTGLSDRRQYVAAFCLSVVACQQPIPPFSDAVDSRSKRETIATLGEVQLTNHVISYIVVNRNEPN